MVATDLDGTLLDAATYTFDAARPALAELTRLGVQLVLASSKTRGEMIPLAAELGPAVLVVENGGAILLPRPQGGYETLVRGRSRAHLVAALATIARETGAAARGFAQMSSAEVAERTGLDPAGVRRAREREYDEPFVLERENDAALVSAAARRHGLRVTRGGRFFHLTGKHDKGAAFAELVARFAAEGRSFSTVGLGDAPNDLPLLRAVKRPIVLPQPDGQIDPKIALALPTAERAPAPGPAGWNRAILAVLAGERLPGIREAGREPR
jgi:mannosyl-3-phosphoglycerate phosphatase